MVLLFCLLFFSCHPVEDLFVQQNPRCRDIVSCVVDVHRWFELHRCQNYSVAHVEIRLSQQHLRSKTENWMVKCELKQKLDENYFNWCQILLRSQEAGLLFITSWWMRCQTSNAGSKLVHLVTGTTHSSKQLNNKFPRQSHQKQIYDHNTLHCGLTAGRVCMCRYHLSTLSPPPTLTHANRLIGVWTPPLNQGHWGSVATSPWP